MLFLSKDIEISTCNGKLYRYRKNTYIAKDGSVNFNDKFVPLKRLSCFGCDDCGWSINECFDNDMIPLYDTNFEDYDIVKLIICNEKYDWESGIVDNFDLKFIKV